MPRPGHRRTHRLASLLRPRWLVLAAGVGAVTAVAIAASLHVHVVDVGPSAPAMDASRAGGPAAAPTPPAGSAARFQFLAAQTSNSCGLQPSTVMSYADSARIQGACCNPMDMAKYSMQVQGLREYASIPRILQDPYDVPAALAKQLLTDDQTIHLTSAQQAVYDHAMTMTDDKGPCCCHCWRWNATEGLARYLIADRAFAAADVARVVDLTNGCGGPA